MFRTDKKLTLVGDAVPVQVLPLPAKARNPAAKSVPPAQKDALLKSAELRSAIFNSTRFAGIVTDAAGLVQSFGPGAQRILGYSSFEVSGKLPMMAFHDPVDLLALARSLALEFSVPVEAGVEALVFRAVRGLSDDYELDLIRRDGSRFPALVTVLPLLDDRQAVVGYLLIPGENATRVQSLQAELARQAHHDSESHQRAILNSLEAEIAVVDRTGVIREVNDTWRRFAIANGIEPHQPAPNTGIGTNYLAFCDTGSGSVSPAYHGIQGVLNGSMPSFTMEYPCHSPTEQRWFTMCVLPLGTPGTGAVIAHTDISAYRRMDQLLKARNAELDAARQIAEKANLAKTDFLSSMSHELRTPLGAILGFAQLLETGSPAPTPGQMRSVDQILQAGWYQLELINEILDLAMVESGKLSLTSEAVPLTEVMQECEAMVEVQARKRGIHVSFPRLERIYVVQADRVRLKQVLINLLSNAIKYNRAGGRVMVDCLEISPGRVRIEVQDTGEGLSEEKIGQLFQSFNRLGQEAGREEGTGIGLVMTKRLVELMGGAVGVRSTAGKGSVFWIEMGLTNENDACVQDAGITPAPGPALIAPTARRKMLYVEDSLPNLMLVQTLMERRPDLLLLTSRDGITGLGMAKASQPDVILMDINLPGMSGLETMSLLAADPATSRIPVIAISATAMKHDIEKGLQAGFFRYLTKPIRIDEFMATLDEALNLPHAKPL